MHKPMDQKGEPRNQALPKDIQPTGIGNSTKITISQIIVSSGKIEYTWAE